MRLVGRRSLEPHHRRRRAVALAAVALLALIAGISVGAGGGSTPPHSAVPPDRYFVRLGTVAGQGPGSFAAIEQSAENAAINRTLDHTPYVRVAGTHHREIALTFDDGPGPFTPQILSILERDSVPATFFEVGVLETYFHGSTASSC